AVAQGQRVLITRREGLSPAPPSPSDQVGLSARQLEVLVAMCESHSNKLIAQRLQITEKTVKAHVSAIFDKLQVANRTQATLAAQRLLLLSSDSGAPRAGAPR